VAPPTPEWRQLRSNALPVLRLRHSPSSPRRPLESPKHHLDAFNQSPLILRKPSPLPRSRRHRPPRLNTPSRTTVHHATPRRAPRPLRRKLSTPHILKPIRNDNLPAQLVLITRRLRPARLASIVWEAVCPSERQALPGFQFGRGGPWYGNRLAHAAFFCADEVVDEFVGVAEGGDFHLHGVFEDGFLSADQGSLFFVVAAGVGGVAAAAPPLGPALAAGCMAVGAFAAALFAAGEAVGFGAAGAEAAELAD
jgi:hypothetical protein